MHEKEVPLVPLTIEILLASFIILISPANTFTGPLNTLWTAVVIIYSIAAEFYLSMRLLVTFLERRKYGNRR